MTITHALLTTHTGMTQQGAGEREKTGEVVPTEPDLALAFRLVCQTPQERLLSITLQMLGCAPRTANPLDPAGQVVQAMALVALGREADALKQLRALGDHCIAAYLSEQVRASGGRLGDVRLYSFRPEEPRVGALCELARIFRVLAQERLCDVSLRDHAYQVALQECNNNVSDDREETRQACASCLEELIEEVRDACGLEMSLKALQLRSNSPQTLIQAASNHSTCPTSLTSSSSCSLPSHLEISATSTQQAEPSHTHTLSHEPDIQPNFTHTQPTSIHTPDSHSHTGPTPGSVGGHGSEGRLGSVSEPRAGAAAPPLTPVAASEVTPENTPTPTPIQSAPPETPTPTPGPAPLETPTPTPGPAPLETPTPTPGPAPLETPTPTPAQCSGRDGTHQLLTSVSTGLEPPHPPDPGVPEFSRSVSAPDTLSFHKQEEETVFYAFVILHAPEDEAVAEKLRETLEVVTSGTGATFSQDFHLPGRAALTCMDDAINNSAFTILLLTRNFSSRMQEVLTNSALMNAIENRHKYNTVIPLLPKTNPLPSHSQPLALRTLVQLQEAHGSFTHKARKAMGPQRVAWQRRVWLQEQEEARLRKNSERIQEENRRRREQIRLAEQHQRQCQEAWELYHKFHSMQNTSHAPPTHPYPNPPGARPPPTHPYPNPPGARPPPTHPYPNPPGARAPPPNPPSTYLSWPPHAHPSMYWPPPPPTQPNISIHNASCIMIGNDSSMTIGDPSVIQGGLENCED